MLEWMRSAVTSWVAKLLLALLILSFAAWGVGDMLQGRGANTVAVVGDQEISIGDFRREYQASLNAYGGAIDPSQARLLGLDQLVLQQMAGRAALDEAAEALGIDASDDAVSREIRQTPAFQTAGVFDESRFSHALSLSGLRRGDFFEDVRADIARQTLIEAVRVGGVYPKAAVEAIWRNRNETRDIEYLVVGEDAIAQPAEATDAELVAFHRDNAERFTAPEYRQIVYLWVRAEDRANPDDVADFEIDEAYEARIDLFSRPERRNVEQIVYESEEAATLAAGRIADNESFEKVAADRGLTPGDYELGYVARGDLFDPAIAEAAFGDTTDGLVGPIETDLGWALLNIRGVAPAETTPIEAAREQLRADLAIEIARSDLPDLANSIEDQRAGGALLSEIGDKEQLLTRTVTVDRNGLDSDGRPVADLPPDPSFLARAFEMDVAEEMDLAELPSLEYYALEVEEIIDPALIPLEDVRDRVTAAWTAEQVREALDQEAAAIADRWSAGELAETLAQAEGVEIGRVDRLSRTGGAAAGLSDAAVAAIFETASGDVASAAGALGGERLIARVVDVHRVDPPQDDAEIALAVERAQGGVEADLLQLFSAAALDEVDFVPYFDALNYAVDPGARSPHGGAM